MSVLLWWLPALLLVVIAWWRLRPRPPRQLREADVRTLQRLVRDEQ